MVFNRYAPSCRGGEQWLTREAFDRINAAASARIKKWQQEHLDRGRAAASRHRAKYPEIVRQRVRDWRAKDPEKTRELGRAQSQRSKYKDLEGFKKKRNIFEKKKRDEDALYYLKVRTRNLIVGAFLRGGYKKNTKTERVIGCSFQEFSRHLEALFLPDMSWENRHLWHIDHIIPIASAKTEEDVILLSHHTNLRPLWAADNMKKGAKILP